MSTASTPAALVASTAPIGRCVRAYFAPVNRVTGEPTFFDAAQMGDFALDAPPAPWVDLGWCSGFSRKTASKITALRTGAPAVAQLQARTELEATVHVDFQSWGKLQLALASGSEQMNLLATAAGAAANGSGGASAVAVPLARSGQASTATALNVGLAAAGAFATGDLIAVDVDYTGQTGYVGGGVSAAWVRTPGDVEGDANYVRRVTLNVARVLSVADGILQLGQALLAGTPTSDMRVSRLRGFVDREGGFFFQEWSGLFCIPGEQEDRLLYHYPRLQTMQTSGEVGEVLSGDLHRWVLSGSFRALPTKDANDGATVLCYRSYLPAPMRLV